MNPYLIFVVTVFAGYGLRSMITDFIGWNRRRQITFEPRLETLSDIHYHTERMMKPTSQRGNQPWTEDDLIKGLFNGLGQKITPHTDPSRRCNPGPCPMPELEDGHYICQVCGYEIDYRKGEPVRSDEL